MSASTSATFSTSPQGEMFHLPQEHEYEAEFKRIKRLANKASSEGKEIVVVMGLGFVGAVMAAIIADSKSSDGCRPKFVIGCQRPSERSFWKIPLLNRGESPVKSEDPEVSELIYRAVKENNNLVATYNNDCLSLADCVVIDIQCDYLKNHLGDMRSGEADMSALNATIKTIGQKISPYCLVLIETTVAPGTTEFVAYPILKKEFENREIETEPILAHSFERVMPGKNYVSSIRDFWRVCAGCNDESRRRVVSFLRGVLNTADYPLTVLSRPIESETTKIIENSYRATILAFLNEWSTFAERNGIDLIKVIDAIKKRPTHSNIIFPGPGVGGYCLPKDGALGYWAYKNILGFEDGDSLFKITPAAVNINDTRAFHVTELVRDALSNMGKYIPGADIAICGASYRQDVGDTRYSGSELIVRKLTEIGAEIHVHDPYVDHWYEFEKQDSYPTEGRSLSRYFKNQDNLTNITVHKDLSETLNSVDAVILAIPHKEYLQLDPERVVKWARKPVAVVDCFGILSDDDIKKYFELGCEVKALGRGHIQRIKENVRKKNLNFSGLHVMDINSESARTY